MTFLVFLNEPTWFEPNGTGPNGSGWLFGFFSHFRILEARLRSQNFPKHQSRSFGQNTLSNQNTGWGFPAGVRNSAAFEKCPKITKPDGVESIVCDGSTCMSGKGFTA